MKTLYFTANRDIMDQNGEPVKIAKVPCRFRAGRHYEIPVRGNGQLIAELESMIAKGDLKRLTTAVGADLVEKQADNDRRAREKRRAAGQAPAGHATVEVK